MRMDLSADLARRSYRATPKRLMTAVKHRCLLLLMAKYRFTSAMTSHYDTPGAFDKTSWFVTKKWSTLKLKGQVGATK